MTLMRRISTLLVIVAMMMAGCTSREGHEALLENFYDEYLALTCPPAGERTDWIEVQKVVQRYLTPELFLEWELSHNADLDCWIDYDMFIQGQDCWPGIRAERIERIEGSQWYVVEVVLPEIDNPDSIQKRDCVFFHLMPVDDGEWAIDCIHDGCNRLGRAPADEESALKNNSDYQKNECIIT